MEPTVVSDPVNFESDAHRFSGNRALTNTDKKDFQTGLSNWVGRSGTTPAYFVYDLGCLSSLSELVLRNGANSGDR